MKPLLVLHARPQRQPLLVGFAILFALSVALPLAGIGSFTISVRDVFGWITVGSILLRTMRPLRLRIIVPEPSSVSIEYLSFSDVTALYAWNRYLGVCDADGITIVRPRVRWTVKQLNHLAATLGVPLTVHRDGMPKAATGSRMMADLMAGGAVIAGSDVILRDLGKHGADVSRLARILSDDSLPSDSDMAPRVGLRNVSGTEVAKAAAALLDAGAQIRLERASRMSLH